MNNRPLVVDLDGTYLLTDTLFETFFFAIIHQPRLIPGIVKSLFSGIPSLKLFLAERVSLDYRLLPRNPEVVTLIDSAKREKRQVFLATAANSVIASQFSEFFDGVWASNSSTNLKGDNKAKVLLNEFGEKGFDYVGDSNPDKKVWSHSHTAYLVGKASKHTDWAEGAESVVVFGRDDSLFSNLIKEVRPHQWAKNILIFAPLIAAGLLSNLASTFTVIIAFLAFCCVASANYIINDLVDLENDRSHSRKRYRPIASGKLSIPTASGISLLLFVIAGTLSAILGSELFSATLILYCFLTAIYSFKLKKIAIVDAVTLGILYTLRIVAGAVVLNLPATFWLLTFSLLFFFSLALMKRFSELYDSLVGEKEQKIKGRGYQPTDLELVSTLGVSSGIGAILFLSLYLYSGPFAPLFSHFVLLWTIVPIVLLWVSRAWLIAHRGEMNEDPVLFAVKDRFTLIVGLVFVFVFLFAITVS